MPHLSSSLTDEAYPMQRRKESSSKPPNKLRLVHDRGAPDPISSFSKDEQTRLLALADVALHNPAGRETRLQAGDRARHDHQRLKQELHDAVARFERKRKRAGA